jgi:hypothetical protein
VGLRERPKVYSQAHVEKLLNYSISQLQNAHYTPHK